MAGYDIGKIYRGNLSGTSPSLNINEVLISMPLMRWIGHIMSTVVEMLKVYIDMTSESTSKSEL